MSLVPDLDKLTAVPGPSAVRPAARRTEGQPPTAPGSSAFAKMLKGHGAHGQALADMADDTAAQGPARARTPGQADEADTGAPDAPQAAAPEDGAARPAGEEGGLSTLQMAQAAQAAQAAQGTARARPAGGDGDDPEGTATLAGLKDAARGHGARHGGRLELGTGKDARADAAGAAEAGRADTRGTAAASFAQALQAGGAAGPTGAADGAAGSPAQPVVDQALAVNDGSLPSLGAQAPLLSTAPAAASNPAEAAPPPASAELPVPPGHPAFPQAVGVQLSTWLRDGVEHASLELHPRELGPIEVRIAVRDGATQIDLGADVASTRAALAEALPQLADQLGEVGLSLSGGSVSDQTGDRARQLAEQAAGAGQGGDRRNGDGPAGAGRRGGRGEGADALGALATSRPAVQRRGLLDLYA